MMTRSRKRDLDGRTKMVEKTMKDRLSNLTEPLKIEILSLLELKDAVKTGVLAKSWKNIWTQVKNIDLRRTNFDGIWVSSVDSTLSQCTTAKIDRFCLNLGNRWIMDDEDSPDIVSRWIPLALDRNAKTVELSHLNQVPARLFQNESVTTLELAHCGILDVGESPVNLTAVKSLRLEHLFNLNDKSLENLIRGCPVLQNLVLTDNNYLGHINIMSPSVERFTLDGFENDLGGGDLLKITAPWLQELHILRIFFTGECELVDVSSLTKATLTFHSQVPMGGYVYGRISMVAQLLNSLSYVGDLTLGAEPLQVLSLYKLLGALSPVFKCKRLTIETSMWKFDLPGIVCLLENAPHLETLYIKVLNNEQDESPLFQTAELLENEDHHLRMPDGKFMNLKNIVIVYWRYPCCDDTESSHRTYFDFELMGYIVRSAVALQKIVMRSSSGRCRSGCPLPDCGYQYVYRLSSKLMATSPGGNEAAKKWELKWCKNEFVFTYSN